MKKLVYYITLLSVNILNSSSATAPEIRKTDFNPIVIRIDNFTNNFSELENCCSFRNYYAQKISFSPP